MRQKDFALPPIRLENLVKDYGSLRAVDHVDLEMRPGEILGLLGPNGAGKTTIISMLVTLEKPTSGRARVFGLDVSEEAERVKMLMGFVPQELINHGYFSVLEIMEFHSGYFGRRKNKARIEYLLNRLSLWEHRHKKVKQLSGGMKRRLLIAKSLVHEPQLLLLDEPTAGVDIELRESLWQFVEELKKDGMSILLTTHYIQEAEQLCDRIGILQKGKLRHLGETRELITTLTNREVALKFKESASSEFYKNLSDEVPLHPNFLHRTGDEFVFQIPASMGVGDLLADLGFDLKQVSDLVIREGSLEDALKRVLGDSQSTHRAPNQNGNQAKASSAQVSSRAGV